jgi:hypothetical protein
LRKHVSLWKIWFRKLKLCSHSRTSGKKAANVTTETDPPHHHHTDRLRGSVGPETNSFVIWLMQKLSRVTQCSSIPHIRLYRTKVKLQSNQSHPFLSCFLDYGLSFQEFVSTRFMSFVFLFFCVFGLSTVCVWVLQMTSSLVMLWIPFLQI